MIHLEKVKTNKKGYIIKRLTLNEITARRYELSITSYDDEGYYNVYNSGIIAIYDNSNEAIDQFEKIGYRYDFTDFNIWLQNKGKKIMLIKE